MRDILKAGSKIGFATLAGLLAWVVAGKVMALTLGAAGVGIFGLLRQLLQNLTLVGSFNGQTALVQGIASRANREDQLRYSKSIFWILVLCSGGMALLLLAGAPWLAPLLIPHPQSVPMLRWLGLAMMILVAQTYVIGLLNGHRMINELVKSQILGPVTVLLLVLPVIWLIRDGNAFGFILMLAGPAGVVTLAAARSAWKVGWLPSLRGLDINRSDRASFFHMSAVLLITGIVTTGAQFFQSWLVARKMGLAEVGQFWTAWTLSMSYVTLVLGSLGTYYMPSLSRLEEPEARRSLVRDYLRLCLLTMPVLVSAVVVFKPWVIQGMFSSSLLPALKVMRWMLIGDLFKGISWVLAFPMLAFSEMKWFFWTDVLFSLVMVATAWVWVLSGGGIQGLGLLFMILYMVYFPVMMYYVWHKHGFAWQRGEVLRFLGGLLLVVVLSVMTWNDETVRWWSVASLLGLGGLFTGLSLKGKGLAALLLGRTPPTV